MSLHRLTAWLDGTVRLGRARAAMAVATVAGALTAAGPAQAATLTRIDIGSPNSTAFLLNGTLVGGELLKLQAEVAKLPPSGRIAVVLDSPGGLVAEGLKLGQFFYEAKIATFVFAGGIG